VQEAPAQSKGRPVSKGEPASTAAVEAEAGQAVPAAKPKALKSARAGKADDLKRIVGIGPKLEALCHRLGFFHFDQIAAWTRAEIAWVDDNLDGFKGRVTRDNWVSQAKALASGANGQGRA
jgi:NADH-quinone oxidoreductase subunit E